jgi:hypothetical protein
MLIRAVSVSSITALVATATLASQQVPANDSARVETIRKLLTVGRVEELHTQLLAMITARYSQIPALAPYAETIREFLKTHGSFAAIEGDLIAVYREYYSETDLQELLRFQESPIGQKVTAVAPLISVRTNDLVTKRMEKLLPELMRQVGRQPPPD